MSTKLYDVHYSTNEMVELKNEKYTAQQIVINMNSEPSGHLYNVRIIAKCNCCEATEWFTLDDWLKMFPNNH